MIDPQNNQEDEIEIRLEDSRYFKLIGSDQLEKVWEHCYEIGLTFEINGFTLPKVGEYLNGFSEDEFLALLNK